MQRVISEQRNYAKLINLASHQAGLSHRIAYFASLMATTDDETEFNIARSQIGHTISKMENTHQILLNGSIEDAVPLVMNDNLRIIYFDPMVGLDLALSRFLERVRQVYQTDMDNLSTESYSFIFLTTYGPHVLEPMFDAAVDEYEMISREAILEIENFELFIWLAAIAAFIIVFAGANRAHPYYQLHLLAPASLLFGYCIDGLCKYKEVLRSLFRAKLRLASCVFVLFALSIGYGWGYHKFFSYMYDTDLRMPYAMEVSEILQRTTPENAVFLLNQPGAIPAVISYYSRRRSLRFGILSDGQAIEELEQQRSRGATLYVAVDTHYGSGVQQTKRSERFWNYLRKQYHAIIISEHYLIFDLTQPNHG
jgi:hypothetical protein